jgi:hypothetical protein
VSAANNRPAMDKTGLGITSTRLMMQTYNVAHAHAQG